MKDQVSRRTFLAMAAAGAAAGSVSGSAAAPGSPYVYKQSGQRPALLGGEPVRLGRFPSWPTIDEDDREIWETVLQEKAWCELNGHQVEDFEKEFQAAMGDGYVVATANGTSSLHAALHVLEVGPGDEVLMPAHTFIATMQSILNLYALPIFVDIDPASGQIDPGQIESRSSSQSRAVIPVHLGGGSADMDGVLKAASNRDLKIVEDVCQSALSEWGGTKLGLLGDCGAISFQVSKIIPAGEGGAVVTRSEAIRTLVHAFRNNGRDPDRKVGNYPYFGMNYRMTEFQGALLRTQLGKFERLAERRRANAALLDRGLEEIGGISPLRTYSRNNKRDYYYYAMRYDGEQFAGLSIDRFVEAVRAEGIPISGSSGSEVLPDSPSIKRVLESRGFQRIYSKEQLNRCLESRDCPHNRKLAGERLVFNQSSVLGGPEDIQDILSAVERVKTHAAELKG